MLPRCIHNFAKVRVPYKGAEEMRPNVAVHRVRKQQRTHFASIRNTHWWTLYKETLAIVGGTFLVLNLAEEHKQVESSVHIHLCVLYIVMKQPTGSRLWIEVCTRWLRLAIDAICYSRWRWKYVRSGAVWRFIMSYNSHALFAHTVWRDGSAAVAVLPVCSESGSTRFSAIHCC